MEKLTPRKGLFINPEWHKLKGRENRMPNQFSGEKPILPSLTKKEKSLAQIVKEAVIFQQ